MKSSNSHGSWSRSQWMPCIDSPVICGLGMRERVEMVGGKFRVESAPGKETTVWVEIPQQDIKSRKPRNRKSAKNTTKST